MSGVHAFHATTIDGTAKALDAYAGKILLIVNVASECGLTPQYRGLEELHERYHSRGLCVLGFPANEFGGQEPGTDAQIQTFCERKFGVKFDMFSKVKVKGEGTHPLFAWLQDKNSNPAFGGTIKWNFNKFLIGADGSVLARFEPAVEPTSSEVLTAIEKALDALSPSK